MQIEEPFLEQREVAKAILEKFMKNSTIAPFTEIARAAQQKKLNIVATEVWSDDSVCLRSTCCHPLHVSMLLISLVLIALPMAAPCWH